MIGRFPILYIAEAEAEDAVLSSGVLSHLVESLPQARFTVVGSAASAPLFADTPRLDQLLVLEREGHFEWLALWNQVRATKWGLVVDMRGSALSGKLRRQKRAVRGKDQPGLHAVEAAARVLKLEPEETPGPKLHVADETLAGVEAMFPTAGGDGPILAMGPGVEWMGKRWPAERYAKVATKLLADDGPLAGGRLMIVGEEIDREAAHTIRYAVPRARVIELQGRLTRLQTAAALSKARLYVGADSIWTHLATAAGVPVVAVFGPSDETTRGPWKGVAVRGPRSFEEFRKLDPNLNQAIQHMMDLPWERVLKATQKVLREG
ncbi:glycosyltransferase family 9 protein [Brevundimonas sp.]|uniref:glycosyltransferase family 9 protein n=1 Tax=Brevundimonas sp. TaxID=1871086 RepID=UPI0019CDC1DD|nr:glycosyltransferase family 9 protein [Brevundimonas sp.]MBD3835098.1 glycosyltransferase family 9 protein [Brevundimonas sp.]